MKKILLILLFFPVYSFAGWSGEGTVSAVYSHEGSVIVQSTITDDKCGGVGKILVAYFR